MGRPLAQIDPKIVAVMASVGCTNTEIADYFGVNETTIRKRFSEILIKERAGEKKKLRTLQWKAAKAGNATMLIWLGKQKLGQTDKVETKADTKVVIREQTLDTSPKTDA